MTESLNASKNLCWQCKRQLAPIDEPHEKASSEWELCRICRFNNGIQDIAQTVIILVALFSVVSFTIWIPMAIFVDWDFFEWDFDDAPLFFEWLTYLNLAMACIFALMVIIKALGDSQGRHNLLTLCGATVVLICVAGPLIWLQHLVSDIELLKAFFSILLSLSLAAPIAFIGAHWKQ